MRTKALILTAALSVAGAATSMAQVYSVNAVGYINVPVNPGFNLIANQLNQTPSNLSALLPSVPDGTQAFKFTGAGYAIATFDFGAWDSEFNFGPGEGIFLSNNSGSAFTVTFVGEVPQGTLTKNLTAGFSIVSSIVPQAATASALGLTTVLAEGDQIFLYNNPGGYDIYTRDDLDPSGYDRGTAPTLGVGRAFFLNKATAGSWVRTFTVN